MGAEYREQWLSAAVQDLSPRFAEAGHPLPENIKISCGFPAGTRGTSKKVLAQTFSPAASKAGATEVFISPVLDDAHKVVRALVRALVIAAVGSDKGLGHEFKAAAHAIGLRGRKAESLEPDGELTQFLDGELVPGLGEYPHAALDMTGRKSQSTRMIKLVCPVSGYTVRTTAKWIKMGLPTSPVGVQMVVENADNGGDE